jgi:type I site-specific restriction endonuclease
MSANLSKNVLELGENVQVLVAISNLESNTTINCVSEIAGEISAEEDEEASVVLIKTEAGVTKGSIDVLLLGDDGVLTIVEAKLSENTREIRRMMIAQAIEYAAQLYSEWDSNRIQSEGEKYWRKSVRNWECL